MASRRKRRPVAFHPRLSAGLTLSLLSLKHSRRLNFCRGENLIWTFFEQKQCPLWVISRPYDQFQLNVGFRG